MDACGRLAKDCSNYVGHGFWLLEKKTQGDEYFEWLCRASKKCFNNS